jgi:putative glutamine transport system substrate-binding protein
VSRIALVVALVAACTAAARADRLADIRARGRLIVSVKNDAKHPHKDPAHFDKRGFEVELAHTLAQKIVGDGDKLELRMLARPVRLPMLAAGQVDLVVSMIPVTPENEAMVDFSHPYFASGLTLLVKAGAPKLALADLAGKTVAFRKQSFNDHGGELLRISKEHGVTVAVRYYPSMDAAAEAVTRGEAAAVGGNFVDLSAYAREHAGFAVDATLLEPRQVAVAVKKGEPALLRAVNDTIDGLRASGALARLATRWHLPYLLR